MSISFTSRSLNVTSHRMQAPRLAVQQASARMIIRVSAQRPVVQRSLGRQVSCQVARPGSSTDADDAVEHNLHKTEQTKHHDDSKHHSEDTHKDLPAPPAPHKADSDLTTPKELSELLKEYKSIFVAGSTGGVGRRVVEALYTQGATVRALTRDVGKAMAMLPGTNRKTDEHAGSVTVVKGDVFQYSSLPAAFGPDTDAVVVCTGASGLSDPFGPFNVDYQGTLNLIALAKQRKVKHFVLVSSIGADDVLNPLNLFYGVLFWKKRAEEELQRSGLTYTIVRPGGLKNNLKDGEIAGSIVMASPGTWGMPPMQASGSILRRQVADVVMYALVEPCAKDKVVEVITEKNAPLRSMADMFDGVRA